MPVRVAIVDDHYVVRYGIGHILTKAAGIVFAGESESAREIEKFVAKTKPDVVLMDVRMPEVDGIEALRRVKASSPSVRVVMLSANETSEEIFQAMESGASGYLLKDTAAGDLVKAVVGAAAGEVAMSPRAKEIYSARAESRSLSARELEVLAKLADGLANKEIADRLQISPDTVKDYIKRLFDKLGVKDRASAVSSAYRHGILKT